MAKDSQRGNQPRAKSEAQGQSAENKYPFRVITFEAIAILIFGFGYLVNASGHHEVLSMWIYAAAIITAAYGIPFPKVVARVIPCVVILATAFLTVEDFRFIKRPNKLDTAVPESLSPTPARPATELPFILPSPVRLPEALPTPAPTIGTITLKELGVKFKQAAKRGRVADVKQGVDDIPVDWTLPLLNAAKSYGTENLLVALQKPDSSSGANVIMFNMPLKGNERLLSMGTLDVFRVRGKIDGEKTEIYSVWLKDGAKLEWVSTLPDPDIPTPSPSSSQATANSTPHLGTLAFKDIARKYDDAIKMPFGGEQQIAEISKALIGMRVDWTMEYLSASSRGSGSKTTLVVSLREPGLFNVAIVTVPLAGNERIPLTDKGEMFRVRGKIEGAGPIGVNIGDATLEYIGPPDKAK